MSTEPRRFHPGGVIPGPPVPVRVEFAGMCSQGRQLYRIDGVEQHLITAEQVAATARILGNASGMFNCGCGR